MPKPIRPLDLDRIGNPRHLRQRLAALQRARTRLVQRLKEIEDRIVEVEEELWRLSGRDRLGGEDHRRNAHQN